jgi:hypothetical protein
VREHRVSAWTALPPMALCLLTSGCNNIGRHTEARKQIDFGPPVAMRLCVYQAAGVPDANRNQLVAAMNKEFAGYKIEVTVPWVRSWKPKNSSAKSQGDHIMKLPLEAPCDRLLVLSGWNVPDAAVSVAIFGRFLPLALGAHRVGVDDATHTRGVFVSASSSVDQLIEPHSLEVALGYLFLGCRLGTPNAEPCYRHIADLKAERIDEEDFFPGVSEARRIISWRADVEAAVAEEIAADKEPAASNDRESK